MEYKYLVRFAHVNESAEDVSGGVHHGPGEMHITTYEPIETQAHRDAVATTIGRTMYEKHGVTEIAIQAIIPQNAGHVVIDAGDYEATDDNE